MEELSPREEEVLWLIKDGARNKDLANELFVTEKCIKFHLTNIFKKTNVKNKKQLILKLKSDLPPPIRAPKEVDIKQSLRQWFLNNPKPYNMTLDLWRNLYLISSKLLAQIDSE